MTKMIALDCDGVLLDFNLAYTKAWGRFAGTHPAERDPQAYWHFDRWEVERLSGDRLELLRTYFDEDHWASIPAIAGALQACQSLHDAGYELVCVSGNSRSRFQSLDLLPLRGKARRAV